MASVSLETATTPATRRRRAWWRPRASHFFLLPYAVFLLAFGVGPALYAVLISFAKFQDGTPQFFAAGLDNFGYALHDFRFAGAFAHVGTFLVLSVPLGVAGCVVLALLLHARTGWFATTMRTVYFLPGAVAGPALVLLAIFLIDPRISPFSPILHALGLRDNVQVVQTSHLPLLFTLIGFFGGAGGWIAIFYGALKGIAPELLEAATVDGATAWQSALYIKLPLISRFVTFMAILTFAANIQIFTEPTLIGAALSYASTVSPTWSPNQLGYTFAFTYGQFGAAAVVSLAMIAIGMGAAFLIIYGTKFYQTDVAE